MERGLLYTQNLSVGYKGQVVVGNVNLDVEPGRIVTLIGPNGAGKSTVLKTITRQLAPLGGTVCLDGRELAALPERDAARTMAILMTDRAAPELMTCWDVASAGRYPYTGRLGLLTEEDKAEVRRALELVGASELAEREFHRVSDGQRQLVMLARAICQRPKVLVLDEPTSFLDIRYKMVLLSILKDLVNQENLAVVMSLHELDLTRKVSDTILCVKNGAVDRMGSPWEIFSGQYIAELYGVTPDLLEQTRQRGIFVEELHGL